MSDKEEREQFALILSPCENLFSPSQQDNLWELWDYDSELNALEMLINMLSDFPDNPTAAKAAQTADDWLAQLRLN